MIGAIENAIIAKIQAASDASALGYRFKTVESFGQTITPDNLRRSTQSFPAALVVFAGEPRPTDGPGGKTRHSPMFTIFLCQKNRRGDGSSRSGKDGKVGTYQMIEDVRGLLSEQTLGLAIDPIKPGAVRSVMQDDGPSIYALELHVGYDANPRLADSATLDDFATLNADWDVPVDGTIDATDTITLETLP